MRTITDYKPRPENGEPICFFHRWINGDIASQGFVVELRPDFSAVVMLISWDGGIEKSKRLLVNKDRMAECTLYATAEEMIAASAWLPSLDSKPAQHPTIH